MQGAQVEIRNVYKSYKLENHHVEVLRGANACFAPGERVAIVGASGAGKSTLLHLLGTLDAPTQGEVWIDGVATHLLKPRELADFRNKTIGFVFQFHHLLPDFTALENVAMPAWIAGDLGAPVRARAHEWLEQMGLGSRSHHRPSQLSGGEQQRVALARALMMQPRVLLADEPTGNLDAKTGEQIHELLMEVNRKLHMTLVVVTHNESLAARMPRRLQMEEGQLREIHA